jgi:hypothetical protein
MVGTESRAASVQMDTPAVVSALSVIAPVESAAPTPRESVAFGPEYVMATSRPGHGMEQEPTTVAVGVGTVKRICRWMYLFFEKSHGRLMPVFGSV